MNKMQAEQTSQEWMAAADAVLAATYKRFALVFNKGRGCTLWDVSGKAYTDFVAGIAVCNLGHVHPDVCRALTDQAGRLWHVSNLYYTPPQVELAALLVENSFADRVFFCNSGAEANEAAIKLARKYFKVKGIPERYRIIVCEQSFHGRTMATLSATGQAKVRNGYEPVLEGFDFVPFNDLAAIRQKMGETTCAVMLEPIQGEGGVCCPEPGFLKGVRELCDQTGALLILDEIQTGLGRTGTLFAHAQFEMEPDIMTLAKALANGLPMGAMLARDKIAQAFGPGSHASTFGGTPIVSAAALETLRLLIRGGVIEHGRKMGAYFRERLEDLQKRQPAILDVRGLGLLLGMKLDREGGPIVTACMERGFLINCVQENILRFVPPLIIETEEIDRLVDCLAGLLEEKRP